MSAKLKGKSIKACPKLASQVKIYLTKSVRRSLALEVYTLASFSGELVVCEACASLHGETSSPSLRGCKEERKIQRPQPLTSHLLWLDKSGKAKVAHYHHDFDNGKEYMKVLCACTLLDSTFLVPTIYIHV